jgi:formamidopyrimidine-DNA glycosylase
VGRRGKHILIHLSDYDLIFHLRMSGELRVESMYNEDGGLRPLLPHDRVVLYFSDGHRLAFHNPRKFGRAWLVKDAREIVGHLGPEPFSEALTAAVFYQRLQQHHRQIKPLLLDQTFLAGMGNIYTDEALFLAKIHPLTTSHSLNEADAARLLDAIRQVLEKGIRANGASIDWVYKGGGFQNDFTVYQRTGQACIRCGTMIERMVVGQRGTHFCPICQPHRENYD